MNTQPAATNGLVVAGYLTVLIPVVGFFVGLALIIKNRAGHGITIMLLSVTLAFVAFTLIEQSNSTTDGFSITPAETPWCNQWNDLNDDC